MRIAKAPPAGIHLSLPTALKFATLPDAALSGLEFVSGFGLVHAALLIWLNRQTTEEAIPVAWFRVGQRSQATILVACVAAFVVAVCVTTFTAR